MNSWYFLLIELREEYKWNILKIKNDIYFKDGDIIFNGLNDFMRVC